MGRKGCACLRVRATHRPSSPDKQTRKQPSASPDPEQQLQSSERTCLMEGMGGEGKYEATRDRLVGRQREGGEKRREEANGGQWGAGRERQKSGKQGWEFG